MDQTGQIIYKQIFGVDEAEELNNYFVGLLRNEPSLFQSDELASGERFLYNIDLSEERFQFITDRLFLVLENYFHPLQMDRYGRFYSHRFGSVRPHTDRNHDNKSNYTILIYLTDMFEGKLSVKMQRSVEERKLYEPDKKHKVFTFTPLRGYAVIFHKDLLHWAQETYSDKNFLLLHLSGKV
jgi:hypothetical protein